MLQHTVEVQFQNDKGTEHHTEIAVPLAQLIPSSTLATRDKKEDLLSFAILGVNADGYQAPVSCGEISPEFANKDVLVAVTEDGEPLNRPQLVVPDEGLHSLLRGCIGRGRRAVGPGWTGQRLRRRGSVRRRAWSRRCYGGFRYPMRAKWWG